MTTRARWVQNSTDTWVLRQGGAVLAKVRFTPYIGYVWRAAGRGGYRKTAQSAKNIARRALREGA